MLDEYGYFHTDLTPCDSRGNDLFIPANPQYSTSMRGTKEVLERLHGFLSTAIQSVNTLQAKCQLFAIAIAELDNVVAHLNNDKRLIDQGIYVSLGKDNPLSNYDHWAKTLRNDAWLWNSANFRETDQIHYASPGFDFETFVSHHQELERAFQERMKTIIDLLWTLHFTRPTPDQLVGMYNALESEYNNTFYPFDLNEYENSLVGILRCNRKEDLETKLHDLENQLKESNFLRFLDNDIETARQKLYFSDNDEIDKESVARYIFGHRNEMSGDMIIAFFRYITIGKRILDDLSPYRETKKEKHTKEKHLKTKAMRRSVTILKPTATTFIFEGDDNKNRRLQWLYNGLRTKTINNKSLIDEKTPLKAFLTLFSGQPTKEKLVIKWTGSKQQLAYFFKTITRNQYVSLPPGETLWMVVRSHFVDANGKQFGDDLHDQHTPSEKTKNVLDKLAELLNTKKTEEEIRKEYKI